jgi:PRTRC genetic system ThiF family protein/PRTRC genetic system protein A
MLAVGHKRLLGSAQGLYVEARSAAWDVCARVATVALPYGEMSPRLRCPAGAIPLALLNTFVAQAQASPAREIAAAIVLSDTGFALVWPTVESSSSAHVRYIDTDIDEDRLVIDLHSHGHHDAIFSGTDDNSDCSRRGPHLSMVVGRCHTDQPDDVRAHVPVAVPAPDLADRPQSPTGVRMSVFTIPEVWMDRVVRILLVGAGGTGSQLCDQLASLEVTLRRLGHPGFDVKVLDADEVSASNVGRQRYTEADIGSPKAALMVHRINLFYGLDWEARVERYDPTAYHLGYDLIVTAVDKAAFRAAMGRRHQDADGETLWLDTGNGATSGNVVIGHLAKPRRGQRLPNVFDLFPELAGMTATDAEQPSCSTEEAIARQEWPGQSLCRADRHGTAVDAVSAWPHHHARRVLPAQPRCACSRSPSIRKHGDSWGMKTRPCPRSRLRCASASGRHEGAIGGCLPRPVSPARIDAWRHDRSFETHRLARRGISSADPATPRLSASGRSDDPCPVATIPKTGHAIESRRAGGAKCRCCRTKAYSTSDNALTQSASRRERIKMGGSSWEMESVVDRSTALSSFLSAVTRFSVVTLSGASSTRGWYHWAGSCLGPDQGFPRRIPVHLCNQALGSG